MPIANPNKDAYEPESQSERPQIPKEIWVLVAAFFLVALGYGLIAPLLPQFVVSFDVGMAAAGGCYFGVFRIASHLCDRCGNLS